MADEEVEQTVLILKECYVYKIPPRQTAAGYRYGALFSPLLVAAAAAAMTLLKRASERTSERVSGRLLEYRRNSGEN